MSRPYNYCDHGVGGQRRSIVKMLLLCSAVGVAQIADSAAWAQASEAGASSELEQIVVTARKRGEQLQDVPVSLTAYTGENLEARNVLAIPTLAQSTPGAYLESVQSSRSVFYLRGYGAAGFDAGTDPAVAVFVDEVYLPRFSGMQLDLFDLERIEILKGPQGSLFGRNAAAGAINITTRRPTEEFEASFSVDVGNYNALTARAMISGPLIPGKLLGRVNYGNKSRDGFTTNVVTGRDVDHVSSSGLRGQLEFVGAENFNLRLIGELTREDSGAWVQRRRSGNGLGIFGIPPAQQAAFPLPNADFRKVDLTFDGYQKRDGEAVSARAEWDLGPVELTWLNSMRWAYLDELQDDDSSIADSLFRRAIEDSEQFSSELRLSSNGNSRLSWLVGAYYFREHTDRTDIWTFGTDHPIGMLLDGRVTVSDRLDVVNKSMALFGEVNYELIDSLRVTAGGRYTNEKKNADRFFDPGDAAAIFPAYQYLNQGREWESFDPMISVDYSISPDVMIYGSWRNGFKSGGYQTAVSLDRVAAGFLFDPEEIEAFELGAKTEWFDRRLRLNAAVYRNNIDDLQVLQAVAQTPTGAPINANINAAEIRVEGVELELVAAPTDRLTIQGGYSNSNAEFQRFVDQLGRDLKGKKQVRWPKHQVNASIQHESPLAEGMLLLRGEWSYRTKQFFEFNNEPRFTEGGYHLANLRVSWTSLGGLQLRAFVENLTKTDYCVNVFVLPGAGYCTQGAPRTVGVGMTVKFGNR